MKKAHFLDRDALYWLLFFAPAIALLVSKGKPDRIEPVVRCLLATWVITVVCGVSVHHAVNALWSRTSSALAIGGAVAALVTVEMLLSIPRLAWLDPNLAGSPVKYVLQALVVAAVYVGLARLVTWHRQRAARAQLAALQAQLNPHFLFNTLNAIASLIPNDPDAAEATVERLASVLQYAIASSGRGRVTVAEELAVVRDYLAIEQARFGERLRSTIEIDARIEAQSIPPMLVQPLVENAVLHGLSSREEGGSIVVRARSNGDAVVLEVSDDGVGPGKSKRKGNRTGLANLRERLGLTYGRRAKLSIGERAGGGFACAIEVPRS